MSTDPLELVWREERAAIIATLARRLGDLDLAEDALQDAVAAAAVRWPVDGVPERPAAWLTTTAWRKALDTLRRASGSELRHVSLEHVIASPTSDSSVLIDAPEPVVDEHELAVPDDILRLIITCCHPSLAPEARVALTLRHVAGLTAREIAAAFLVPEQTMEKRLVRARSKIRVARIPFELPDRGAFGERLADVQSVLYLIFSEGYVSTGDGPIVRAELCDDAIWLARQLRTLVPDDMECVGLLALMLLHRARTDARVSGAGQLVPYAEQDRSRWDMHAIDEARALLALTGGEPPGTFQIEAAIALLHVSARDSAHVPWARIAELYALLMSLAPSPIVAVNRAYAVGRAETAARGLAVLAPVLADAPLKGYVPLHVVHADLLQRVGDLSAAAAAWTRAIEHATQRGQRDELRRRAALAGFTLSLTV